MAEEYKLGETVKPDILIKKCASGFIVKGNIYASDELRAFSTAEGLIEWLSRELGAGPIVWSLTLEVWEGALGVEPEDMFPVPDAATNPAGYQAAVAGNALNLLERAVAKELEARTPKPPPEPKPKKGREVKKEVKDLTAMSLEEIKLRGRGLLEEKPKKEEGGAAQGES